MRRVAGRVVVLHLPGQLLVTKRNVCIILASQFSTRAAKAGLAVNGGYWSLTSS